jgi:SAM-dependent methyltransferase
MNDSLAILGRQPELGFAELESLYGSDNVIAIRPNVAQIRVMPCSIDFLRLGGTVKLCKLLTIVESPKWEDVLSFLLKVSPEFSERMPAGKMHLGLSVYGLDVSPDQILNGGLRIKRAIHKQNGRNVQLVPNKAPELSSAQVLHSKLISDNGWELVIVANGDKTIIGQTVFIQNIESYGERDYGRPKRDTRIGMLPPKLAQIILNLAVGPDEFREIQPELSSDICNKPEDDQKMHTQRNTRTILDPFCGTGVMLQEALLMGYNILGTDIESRMVEYTKHNLEWLAQRYNVSFLADKFMEGDATTQRWDQPIDFVASEVYLGRPFTTRPAPEVLSQTMSDCNLIIKKFLRNIHDQLKPGTRLALAIPAWQIKPDEFAHLPLIDQLSAMGYNRLSFKHVRSAQLLYYRADQFVARELLTIVRN